MVATELFRYNLQRNQDKGASKLTDKNVDKSSYFIYNFYEVIVLWTQQE